MSDQSDRPFYANAPDYIQSQQGMALWQEAMYRTIDGFSGVEPLLSFLQEAYRQDPDNFEVVGTIAQIIGGFFTPYGDGGYEFAIETSENFLRQHPDHEFTLGYLAWLYYNFSPDDQAQVLPNLLKARQYAERATSLPAGMQIERLLEEIREKLSKV